MVTPLVCDLIEAADDGLHCGMQQEEFCWLSEQENGDEHIQSCSEDEKYGHVKTCSDDTKHSTH